MAKEAGRAPRYPEFRVQKAHPKFRIFQHFGNEWRALH
jgi:hypothetical protein